MVTAIRMPQPGQMTEECTVLQWFKREGDVITKGDPLFEIETDKSNMEIEAFDEGTLLRIDAAAGQTVPVDAVVAWIGQPGESIPEPGRGAGRAASPPGSEPEGDAASEDVVTTRSPVGAYVPAERPDAGKAQETGAEAAHGRRLAVSPRASRVAAELGVDPRSVTGTGPGGRIVERDIRAAAGTAGPVTPAGPVQAAAGTPSGGSPTPGDGEPLSRLRQVIARRLTENTSVPTFSVTVAVDMTRLMALRAAIKAKGSPITITDLVHAATVQALVELPLVNAMTDGQTFWRREHVDLGVAVALPEGLLVPVVRDAESLSVRGLHDRTVAMVDGALKGTLSREDLMGSTFSVSNMGMFGVEQFTALLNPGESAILAVSSVTPEPAVVGDGIAIRQMMRLTLTADHRLIDGELAARFLNAVKRRLEDADAFASHVAAG